MDRAFLFLWPKRPTTEDTPNETAGRGAREDEGRPKTHPPTAGGWGTPSCGVFEARKEVERGLRSALFWGHRAPAKPEPKTRAGRPRHISLAEGEKSCTDTKRRVGASGLKRLYEDDEIGTSAAKAGLNCKLYVAAEAATHKHSRVLTETLDKARVDWTGLYVAHEARLPTDRRPAERKAWSEEAG